MRYLRAFQFPLEQKYGRTIYPYNSLNSKAGEMLVFDSITLIYGENGSGKSTFLNCLATLLDMLGAEGVRRFGTIDYFQEYLAQCVLLKDETDDGKQVFPMQKQYIKSEDILYEIKKIQQEAILRENYYYTRRKLGMTKEQYASQSQFKIEKQIVNQVFRQEKYSNGETALQIFEDYLQPDGFYLLDEPEASLSPEKQLQLAAQINELARFFSVQFVIVTHSPLLLGALQGTIYNFSQPQLVINHWHELPIVKLYQNFFEEKFRPSKER